MRVIKILVDEIPECCGDCDFRDPWVDSDGHWDTFYITCPWDENNTKVDIHNMNMIRLRSCPLTTVDFTKPLKY